MGKPEFPLEAVLRQRQWLEEEKQLELATLQRRLADEQEILDRLEQRRVLALVRLRDEQARPTLDLEVIGYSLSYVGSLDRAIAAQKQVVLRLDQQCAETREQLLQASQGRKVVEKLKEGWMQRQRQDRTREEEKLAAEAAIGRFSRRQSVAG